ncbi:hypothetical protein PACTADRAFT_36664 [Pachysolen tannophilus NRRL Y-2460]|uniref:STAS domain-containing protein n=1 Tax=Pachysolen tannophilus NRRL Y-2460 TaxID=669874 RepID=A0A1E4U1N9_PACTA|nr:hypothetical protein PACTADRAFT_36664 [Pachysolen tannophilus NRRL Y-2460]
MSSASVEHHGSISKGVNEISERTHYEDHHQSDDQVLIEEYHDVPVGSLQWFQYVFQNPLRKVKNYILSLFPILKWILHYNRQWFYGDIIAGITVGCVLVPQSMSYATLAGLPSEYGLYSSFVGVFIYCFFATSKDVSIGPVAVMSMQISKVIAKVQDTYPDADAAVIATMMSLLCGSIALGLGVLRLGFILEFISIPTVMAFMSGSAINIVAGQVPALMGYNSSVNTRAATYEVIINTLKNLPNTKLDAAFGLVSLFILYAWKYSCDVAINRSRNRYAKRAFFYLQNLRNAVVIVFATLISWGVVHAHKLAHPDSTSNPISILGKVPAGLKHTGVMTMQTDLLSVMAPELPASVIVLMLEHISISKSFGRVNDYRIVPDQELVAIGVTNLIGTFFNAYPATGSFSRSALKAKCGVKTPLAGLFTGAVVLLAVYCFTKAFYYIPKAGLSAIIIHCVTDLVSSYKQTWNIYRVSPIDALIFVAGVFVSIFASIDDSIYFAACASCAHLLWKIAKPNGVFLGRVKVAEVIDPVIIENTNGNSLTDTDDSSSQSSEVVQIISSTGYTKDSSDPSKPDTAPNDIKEKLENTKKLPRYRFHTRWVPLPTSTSGTTNFIHTDLVNPKVDVLAPPPGVLVFRPSESFTYPNCSKQLDTILDEVKRLTKPGEAKVYRTVGDRPWNNPPPNKFEDEEFRRRQAENHDPRPVIKILHFDFSAVTSIDSTSTQALVDLYKAILIYSGEELEFHFSGILSPWIRRSLKAAGFGKPHENTTLSSSEAEDIEHGTISNYYAAIGTDTPFFHLDIPSYEDLE